MKRSTAVLAFTLLSIALPAFADGQFDKLITAADRTRMEKYGETRKEALADARAGGAAEDLKVLEAVLNKPPQSWSGLDMTGNRQCRTIKVVGFVPLVVYGWFKCKVTEDGSGWMLEKLSGLQRTRGPLPWRERQATHLSRLALCCR